MTKPAEVLRFPTHRDPNFWTRELPEARRLEQALANIRADAREQARRYQDETRVPEGGE